MEDAISSHPAFMRCSAVIYLIRLIFRYNGALLPESRTSENQSPVGTCSSNMYSELCPWPLDLALFSCVPENECLKKVASAYAELLEYTKKYTYPCEIKLERLLVRLPYNYITLTAQQKQMETNCSCLFLLL